MQALQIDDLAPFVQGGLVRSSPKSRMQLLLEVLRELCFLVSVVCCLFSRPHYGQVGEVNTGGHMKRPDLSMTISGVQTH